MGRSHGKRERKREAARRRATERAARRHGPAFEPAGESADKTRSGADTVRGGKAATVDRARRWYAVRIAPRMGKVALDGLKARDVVTIAPRVTEMVTRAGRRVVQRRQLLLRTAFIGVRDEAHLDEVRGQRGVASVVSYPHLDSEAHGNVEGVVMLPARLDPDALQGMVDALAEDEIVAPYGVKKDDAVTVLAGPFVGFPAVVEEILPNDRVKVGVSLFGRSTPVELALAEIKRVP